MTKHTHQRPEVYVPRCGLRGCFISMARLWSAAGRQVGQLFIQGRKVDLGSRHKTLYEKYSERHRQLGITP